MFPCCSMMYDSRCVERQKMTPKWSFLDIVFDVASLTCIIYNYPLMRGRAIYQWILFIAPARPRGRRHCRRLTCNKLRRSSKWWSGVTIQQWSTRYLLGIASFPYTPAFDAAVDSSIQLATEMLPLKRGRGVSNSFNCTQRLSDMRLADALLVLLLQLSGHVIL